MPDSDPPPPEETRLAPLLTLAFRSAPRITWHDAAGEHSKTIEGKLLVGSAPDSGIVVRDTSVSRLHAELDLRADGLWIRDLGSRNGTFIGGLQITGARLSDETTFRIGETKIRVNYATHERRPVETWPEERFGDLVGASPAMRELFATLSRVAPLDSSVLIHGETGTGKELVARAIHQASPRASKPFIIVDCAALPESLLDGELFGHARGAFTGAIAARAGAIEAADQGTVFLDEIGELPLSVQPKLLRALESRTVRRVGETQHRTVDVRFISATHRDLLTMVNAGEFREDLFFRLSVIPVSVPPLRERRQDIELLVRHFLSQGANSDASTGPELMQELMSRSWRGNVRELRNFVERARALGASTALAIPQTSDSHQPSSTREVVAQKSTVADRLDLFQRAYKDFREAWIDEGEREYMRLLLERHQRNVSAAARDAGVDRTYIYRLIRKHDL